MNVTSAVNSHALLGVEKRSLKAKVKADIALPGNPISVLRDVTCHMGSHSVCYLLPDTSECALPNPSHAGWYSIYLPQVAANCAVQLTANADTFTVERDCRVSRVLIVINVEKNLSMQVQRTVATICAALRTANADTFSPSRHSQRPI